MISPRFFLFFINFHNFQVQKTNGFLPLEWTQHIIRGKCGFLQLLFTFIFSCGDQLYTILYVCVTHTSLRLILDKEFTSVDQQYTSRIRCRSTMHTKLSKLTFVDFYVCISLYISIQNSMHACMYYMYMHNQPEVPMQLADYSVDPGAKRNLTATSTSSLFAPAPCADHLSQKQ